MKFAFSKLLAIAACILIISAIAVGFVACDPNGEQPQLPTFDDGTYYLSLASDGRATYDDPANVPADVLFVKGEDGVYSLSISLDAGDDFVVRKVGSDQTFGFDILFTSLDALSNLSGGFKVEKKGDFAFKLSLAGDVTLTYSFTPAQDAPPTPPEDETAVTGVQISPTSLLLDIGDTSTLTATVLPQTALIKQVLWASDNTDVATVDQTGLVTAVAAGSATVTVSTLSGGYSAECSVTVRQPVTRIALDVDSITLVAGGVTKSVSVSISPSDATNKGFTFEITAGKEYVNVQKEGNSLTLSGLAAGSATVKVTSEDNPEANATLSVTVLEAGAVYADMQANVQIALDGTAELVPTLDGANIESIEWAISNEQAISLTKNGDGKTATVKGLDFGTSIITAIIRADDGKTYQASSNVLVAEPYYFIYGVGFGTVDWEWEPYIADEQAAKDAGLLLEKEDRGVYSLTRRLLPSNGFQIIFPNIDSFADEATTKWNKNIPSDLVDVTNYYDRARSDAGYVSNVPTQFKVNAAGTYKITLDLTGTSAKVYIKLVSLEASSVELTMDSGDVLKYGESVIINMAYAPAAATVTENDVQFTLSSEFADFEKYVSVSFDFASKKATLSLSEEAPEEFSVRLTCKIHDAVGVIDVPVLPAEKEEIPVSSLRFEQKHYYFNVNNGGLAWQQTVLATVNDDATNKQIRYSDVTNYSYLGTTLTEALRASVDADKGTVTAKALGTITVQATSMADASYTDTCEVTFYSDGLYLIGSRYGGWDSVLRPTTMTLEGTKYANYAFEDLSQTHFQFSFTIDEVDDNDEGFSIAFLGMDTGWDSAIRAANRLNSYGTATFGGWSSGSDYSGAKDPKNTVIRKAGSYLIDVDLSGSLAVWTLDRQNSEVSKLRLEYDADATALKQDVSLQIKLYYFPQYLTIRSSDVKYSVTGADKEYLDMQFDFDAMTLTLTAKNVEFSTDIQLTLSLTVKSANETVDLVIVAQHHLEWASDNKNHWQQCTDRDCDYESEHTAHDVDKSNWTSDEKGHYHECHVCGGYRVDDEPHSFILDADGFYSKGISKCPDCGYVVYETSVDASTQTITITKYNGSFEKIRLPREMMGYKLTTIAKDAFRDNKYLKQIEFSENITTIGANAFNGCTALQSVTIPASVKTIGLGAFQNCIELETARIESDIVGSYMFMDCTALREVYLDGDLQKLEDHIFDGCTALTQANIPTSVTEIGSCVFRNCKLLQNITLPQNLLKIDDSAFNGCVALQSIELPETLTALGVAVFSGCESFKEVYVPASVTKMGWGTFQMCYNLQKATIKAQIPSIDQIFNDCTSLEVVIFDTYTVGTFTLSNFLNCDKLNAVYFKMPAFYVEYLYGGKGVLDENGDANTPKNDRLFKSPAGIRHTYFYSDSRPAEDVFMGPFAGVWHFDEKGEPMLWADTPEDYVPGPLPTMKVHFDIMASGNTYAYYKDTPIASFDGTIDPNGDDLSATFTWTLDKNFFWLGIQFRASANSPAVKYGDQYTFSSVPITKDSRWHLGDHVSLWYGIADVDGKCPAGTKFQFTVTFDKTGLLKSIKIVTTENFK